MIKQFIKGIIVAAAVFGGAAAMAKSNLMLDSEIFVEREVTRQDGSKATVLTEPKLVVPGDRLIFVVKYKNAGNKPASDFTITNPMPKAVAFNGTSDGLETVSVDNGKSWGFLSAMKVTTKAGAQRPATMSDVTHIRWNLKQTLAPGEGGKLIFRGVVK
ncbi:MAG: hypothetical protein V3V15_02615 [Sphingorhabdus sp.]